MNNVIEYLEESTNKHKEKIAIIEENKKITYEQLNNYSKKCASYISENQIFNEPIIIFMNKGINSLIAFFGTAYSGCYYSFINPELPQIRIQQIKNIINSKIVITDDNNINLANKYFKDLKIINIKEIKNKEINNESLQEVKTKHINYDPLYINFTSGSTGVPKGVVISHRSVIDFIDKFTNIFEFSENDIIANQAPFDFDVSVKDIYSSIKMGATLVIVPMTYFSNPAKLIDYLCENKVTTLTWAVSALCLLTTFHALDYKVPEFINKIIFSGEIMPIKHLNIWMNKLPKATFVNVYGPTEITCNCTYHIINKEKEYKDKIPIGKPFPNERVLLLSETNKEIKDTNQVGEICISGTSLALGYYNNAEQTNQSFIQNPNNKNYQELIYKTGDLAYYNENHDLIFNGRKDYQIKYQGHRIELEEIDSSIMKIKEITRCCTIFEEEKSKLYAFYIGNINPKDLRTKLNTALPVYMIPTCLKQINEFPITKNGKIDRKKLMEMMEVKK